VDHRVPLFQVWSEHRDLPWPKLLDFWGMPNLQIVTRRSYRKKRQRGSVQKIEILSID
jgi:hypothetical protein